MRASPRSSPIDQPVSGPPRLYISLVAEYDWLTAVEFGRVDDGQPRENWAGVGESFGYLHLGPADRAAAIGFKVTDFSSFDPEDAAVRRIWDEPLFDAPQLGLRAASAGEVVVAARSLYGTERPSLNRLLFNQAVEKSGPQALDAWTACLQSGDSMAHFALGYTLLEIGRFHEAYRHLRYYAEIAPAHPWSLRWFGRAAEAIGEAAEARAAYERAIELSAAGAEETDAPELLRKLDL